MSLNLHNIAGNAVGAISPWIKAKLQLSTGSATDTDGTRIPAYAPPRDIKIKVQSLTFSDLRQLDGLNIEGEKRALYLTGDVSGVSRADKKGGDIVTLPDGTVWLTVCVLEDWVLTSGWVKLAVVRQNKVTAI